jgi:hypothetical protein
VPCRERHNHGAQVRDGLVSDFFQCFLPPEFQPCIPSTKLIYFFAGELLCFRSIDLILKKTCMHSRKKRGRAEGETTRPPNDTWKLRSARGTVAAMDEIHPPFGEGKVTYMQGWPFVQYVPSAVSQHETLKRAGASVRPLHLKISFSFPRNVIGKTIGKRDDCPAGLMAEVGLR